MDTSRSVNKTSNKIRTPASIVVIPSSTCSTLTATSADTNNICAICIPNFNIQIEGISLSCSAKQGAKIQFIDQ
ncbi:unnamed protein product [Paramecium primaurelia]|uniref:Uncharacterized protein n=1 Tax=Paramecium primaurelia TaxID=5886 RepID=A0A8S1L9K2_PARPR|nr:unnamed protein product [Paramecium primaurelia]CAD8061536.1 unnamed protein product [Paramecium primaurelia]